MGLCTVSYTDNGFYSRFYPISCADNGFNSGFYPISYADMGFIVGFIRFRVQIMGFTLGLIRFRMQIIAAGDPGGPRLGLHRDVLLFLPYFSDFIRRSLGARIVRGFAFMWRKGGG